MQHEFVSREEWLAARTALLDAEKKLAEARTTVVDQRRTLPWTRVEKEYEFDTPAGRQTFAELFDGHGRLIVYHFMFAPEWQDGCPGCSHLADYFDGMGEHLTHHDATFVAISRAPVDKIDGYRQRKGWRFTWVSSQPCDFNYDYQASFSARRGRRQRGGLRLRALQDRSPDLPGTSVFARNTAGEVFHAYSAYSMAATCRSPQLSLLLG